MLMANLKFVISDYIVFLYTATPVVLEAPTLPVLEGEDVTFRCLYRNQTTKEITSNFDASFYKGFSPIR